MMWSQPYLILYFKELGLSSVECAIIYGILTWSNGFIQVTCSIIADKKQWHKQLIFTFSVISTILHSSMLIVPPSGSKYSYNCSVLENGTSICTNINQIELPNCLANQGNATAQDLRNSTICNSGHGSKQKEEYLTINVSTSSIPEIQSCQGPSCQDTERMPSTENNYNIYQGEMFGLTFWSTMVLFCVTYNLFYTNFVLLYGMIYAQLGQDRGKIGHQRLWGTIGMYSITIFS